MRFLGRLRTALLTPSGRRSLHHRWRLTRLTWLSDFVKGDAVRYRLSSGETFVVRPFDRMSLAVFLERSYERLESEVARAAVAPGDVVIDVGSNIGYYAALLAPRVGESGAVLAVEPGPAAFAALVEAVTLLGLNNVTPLNLALAEKPGRVALVVSLAGHDAQQGLVRWAGLRGPVTSVSVEADSLDAVCRRTGRERPIAFVKLDVEGSEAAVLRGASALLASLDRPIIMLEVNLLALRANRTTASDLQGMLQGYTLWGFPLNSDAVRLRPYDLSGLAADSIHNVFAFPTAGAFSSRIIALRERRLLADT